jgi:hypothetical protein
MSSLSRSRTATKVTTLTGAAIFLALSVGAAAAQVYPRDVVAHCARITSQMRELGCMTCDGYRDRMRLACEANGGRIPGSRTLFGTEPFDTGPTGVDRRAQ